MGEKSRSQIPLVGPKLLTDRLSLWQNVVRDYSAMPAQGCEDRLAGLAGVAERDANLTPCDALVPEVIEHVYLAGLWKDHFQPWLMWEVLDPSTPQRASPVSSPSWSWVSLEGGVRYFVDYDMKYLCEFVGYECTLLDEGKPFGEVRGANLTVKGSLGRTTRCLCRIGDEVEELLGRAEVEERRNRALKGEFKAKQPVGRSMSLDTAEEALGALPREREPDVEGEAFAVLRQDEIFLLPVKILRAGDLTGRAWKHGLMLKRNGDGTFRRVGTFTLDHKVEAEDVEGEGEGERVVVLV